VLRKPQTSHSLERPVHESAQDASDNRLMRWFDCEPNVPLQGVALVIHGLNLRPKRMMPIISGLKRAGIDSLRVSLYGHGDNYSHDDDLTGDEARLKSFKFVSYQLWHDEIYRAFCTVKKRAGRLDVPVFLVAYSLGALLGLDLFASRPDVHYDRMVLFAPALKLHGFHHIGRVFSPFGQVVIKSLGPKSYLANVKGTPINAYNALFDCLRHFNRRVNDQLNVPALIIIDDKDELISARKLKQLIRINHLDRWRYWNIHKGRDVKFGTFHHHIIDPWSAGRSVWKDIMKSATRMLIDDSATIL
jgi:alpha-beta hydrolase superfamily lysophospholipase